MASRLDEIFTIDKLRQSWQTAEKTGPQPNSIGLNREIQAKYLELLGLINNKFPDTSRLSGRFDELTEMINQTFPHTAVTHSIDTKKRQAIVDRLEQLEELLWALESSKGDS